MREIQFRETSADTERIKYNTNGIKTRNSKNMNLPKVRTWFEPFADHTFRQAKC